VLVLGEGNPFHWFWIGTHNEYGKMIAGGWPGHHRLQDLFFGETEFSRLKWSLNGAISGGIQAETPGAASATL
jgi:hypothetical protein